MHRFQAERLRPYGESIFDEVHLLAEKHQAIDLASGLVDFEEPQEIVEAAQRAIAAGHNQYALGRGEAILNEAIAAHTNRFYDQSVDPIDEITVVSGVTEGLWSAMVAFIEPGDEVIVFEPFYEPYAPSIEIVGGHVIPVTLHAPEFRFEPEELRAAFSAHTKAILINTPHNPTGTVFSQAELSLIAELCQEFDVLALTDEVYEHIVFDGVQHHRLATLPGMWERTLTFSGASKTFSVTGWRIGWAIGPAFLQHGLRLAHQFAAFSSPTPLQYAVAKGLQLPTSYFQQLGTTCQARRDFLMTQLSATGLHPMLPEGSYFIMADISDMPHANSLDFCRFLIREIGIAAIPPEVFYLDRRLAQKLVRFTFCKRWETLEAATERLKGLFKETLISTLYIFNLITNSSQESLQPQG